MLTKRFIRYFAFPWLLVLAITACSGDDGGDGSPDPENNLFVNPGFEAGADPWFTLNEESGFSVTNDAAHGGTSSALLAMDDGPEVSGDKVYYLVQEISPEEFPEYIEGFYRVENWQRGTERQYLQFVVIALMPQNFPAEISNYQIRYILAGIESPPFSIGNAYFEFLTREDPAIGEWVHFSAPVRDDFQRLWNAVPEDFEKLRLLFEVRYDGKQSGNLSRADVYYDDLYIGDAP